MTTYPTQPTGDNSIDLNNIFASNSTSKIIMSTEEILNGYNNDGETATPLTSKPDGNKFNYFWYQVHNTLAWVVNYAKALYDNKLELSGGTLSGILAMGANKITGLSAGTADTDAVNKAQLDSAVNGAKWVGEIWEMAYPYIPTLPSGMEVVECDGRALNKADYPTLYAIMGTTYGGTEAGTTFNIPDKRGVVTRGWDHGRGLDPSRLFGSYQVDAVPNISASAKIAGGNDWDLNGIGQTSGAFSTVANTGSVGISWYTSGGGYGSTLNFNASSSNSKYGDSTEVRMKNTTGYFVMRIK